MAAGPSPAWIEPTQRRQDVRAAMLVACDREASRARARSRRLERETEAGRALVRAIVAEGQERQDRESGPPVFSDTADGRCPTAGALAAWASAQSAGRDARRVIGTATADPAEFARRLDALADLIDTLARIALALADGQHETPAELEAREGIPAETVNRALAGARSFADYLTEEAFRARRHCGRTLAKVHQGARASAVADAQNVAAAARALCADVVHAGRDYLWSLDAQRVVRDDVLDAVGAFLDPITSKAEFRA